MAFGPAASGASPMNGGSAAAGWMQNKQAAGDLPPFPLSQREMFTVVRTWKSVQKEIVDTGMRMFLRQVLSPFDVRKKSLLLN
jgi:hypothetical protein